MASNAIPIAFMRILSSLPHNRKVFVQGHVSRTVANCQEKQLRILYFIAFFIVAKLKIRTHTENKGTKNELEKRT